MKDSRYLTHDLGARNDPKLIELQMEMGGTGLAIWWCLVEMLWENDGYIPFNPKAIAYSLRWATEDEVRQVLTGYNLFDNDGELAWSPSALERITHRNEQTARMKEGGRKGGKGGKPGRKADEATLEGGLEATLEAPLEGRVEAINDINDINKLINYYSPASAAKEKEEIFYILFSRNIADPVGETKRLFDYYTANGWTWANGRPVRDVKAVARHWKPVSPEKRFDQAFLDWYERLYHECGCKGGMLTELVSGTLKGSEAELRYTSRKNAEVARNLIAGKPSAAGINIDYKY